MTAQSEKAARDPRIAIVADVMLRMRLERLKRMIEVHDLRKNKGRVRLEEEAAEILAALDAHDVAAFDAAIAESRP